MSLNINGIDHRLELVDPFSDGTQFVLYLKQSVSGQNISFPSLFGTNFQNYSDGVAAMRVALETMNSDIEEFYGTPTNEKTGRALIEELMGLITVVNGRLSLNA